MLDRLSGTEKLPQTAVALGYFDGLHTGHAAVIGCALDQPTLTPAVFTFYFDGDAAKKKQASGMLLTEAGKREMLAKWGVKLMLCPAFSEFASMSPETFVEQVLVGRLNAAYVCCGADFRFGYEAAAGIAELGALCEARDIVLEIVPDVLSDAARVSSSRIRALLGEGKVEPAAVMLGRVFGYRLTVVEGKKLGRTIGSPTINQRLPEGFVRVRYGVYASVVGMPEGGWLTGVTNIGLRPTVEDSFTVNSETYIHNFSGDLYGQQVEVRLLSFLRDEQKFESVAALRMQINADAQTAFPVAREYLSQNIANMGVAPLHSGNNKV